MSDCDVSCCRRPATIAVRFQSNGRWWEYCTWHGARHRSDDRDWRRL